MRTLFISLFTLLLGGVVGYQFGSFGPKLEAGLQATYDNDIDRDNIKETLQNQARAWNTGDIDAFMQDYWQSDALRFASGGDINTGWDVTKARYIKRYPDKTTMGELAFTDLDVQLLSKTDALVFGRWRLTRENDSPNGLFTLHFKRMDGQWKIVSDHTSSASP